MASALSRNIRLETFRITKEVRAGQLSQKPACLWFTGLSGAGKSTFANLIDWQLQDRGRKTCVLDGDNLRHGLCRDLGFGAGDHVENIRRAAEVARLMVDAGLIVVAAFISPFRQERAFVRSLFGESEFFEIYLSTPLAECEGHDPKGLYRKARLGELRDFTGIDSRYEPPENPELQIDTSQLSPEASVEQILRVLKLRGVL